MSQVYYADYNAETTGATPAGFELNDATNFLPVISTSHVFEGAKCVQLIKNVAASTGLHYFALDTASNPGTGDYEAECVVYFDGDDTTRAGVAFRGKDAATNQCYAAMLRGGNSLRLSHITGTTETTAISTVTVAYDAGIFYHIKISANGSAIKVKFWADGASEPGTWDIEVTNTALDNTNHFVGPYFFNGQADSDDVFFDVLKVNDFNTGVTVNAAVQTITSSIPAPTITAIRNLSVSASVQTITSSLPAPTVLAIRNVVVAPDALVLTASQPSPTVSTGVDVTINASVQTIVPTLPATTVSAVRNVNTDAGVQAVTSSQPSSTITAQRNVSVAAEVLTVASFQPAPTISTTRNVSVELGVQTIFATAPVPTILAERNVIIEADVQILTVELLEIVVATGIADPDILSLKKTILIQRGAGLRLKQNGGYTKLSQQVSKTVLK